MERGVFTDLVGVEPALMGENIYLALQAIGLGVWVQAHHLETAFYDHFYGAGSYPESIRGHLNRWHGIGAQPAGETG